MNTLEKMGWAICKENAKGSEHLAASMWDSGRDLYMRLAAVSLDAIRHPSDALIDGACDLHSPGQPVSVRRPDECPRFEQRRRIWSDGIDAIREGRA